MSWEAKEPEKKIDEPLKKKNEQKMTLGSLRVRNVIQDQNIVLSQQLPQFVIHHSLTGPIRVNWTLH